MNTVLNELVDRVREAHGDRVVSLVLYGSAASGDQHGKFSDLNVLCVLKDVTLRELVEAEPIAKWWREQGNPSPLLMSEREVKTATDCFPIEFHDMQERRRVLDGRDIIAEIEVDTSFYRAQLEHELRAKLLRLRQNAAGVLSDKAKLFALMLESVSTFCVLVRHGLMMSGIAVGTTKREIVEKLPKFGVDAQAFTTLLDIREQKTNPESVDPNALFAAYLAAIQAMVDRVDALAK